MADLLDFGRGQRLLRGHPAWLAAQRRLAALVPVGGCSKPDPTSPSGGFAMVLPQRRAA